MSIFDIQDTICAPATGGGGAVSIIRVSGAACFHIIDSLVDFAGAKAVESPGGRIKFGRIFSSEGVLLDEVLVSLFRAPHSYTGEDSAEINCHASPYIVGEILRLLENAGCRPALPGEFTQRAFINGKMDLTQAEAVADVIASATEASHAVAMNQLRGGFSDQLAILRGQLLEMATLLELELDFSEEDVEFADRSKLSSLLDKVLERIAKLTSSFQLGNVIKNGVPVAIAGATNAGKSTLLNCILGEQRAIVSDIAGTTRDTIEECRNIDGVLFRFIDTAGIRENSKDTIENIGISRSFESIDKAEIVIVVVDALAPDLSSLNSILAKFKAESQTMVIAFNKCDAVSQTNCNLEDSLQGSAAKANPDLVGISAAEANPYMESIRAAKANPYFVRISAKTGSGVEEMLKYLADTKKASLRAAAEDSVLLTNRRHYHCLQQASEYLSQVREGITSGLPTDLLAEDLRAALQTLGTITGEITHTEVLQSIFSRFCIGK